jgi:hypothetical protein
MVTVSMIITQQNMGLKAVIGTECIGSGKSNYHTITTTTAPISNWSPFNNLKWNVRMYVNTSAF